MTRTHRAHLYVLSALVGGLSLGACEAELPVSKAAASSTALDPSSAATTAGGPVSVRSLLPGVGDAGDVATAAPGDVALALEPFLGAWRGAGTFADAPATAELEIRRSLGRRFFEVRYVLRTESARYEGFGLFRPTMDDASRYQLWWFDNEGGAPETGAAEATADAGALTFHIERRDGNVERFLFEAGDGSGTWMARTFTRTGETPEALAAEIRYERRPAD